MTTVNDIVTRAMRKIGVVARDENPDADQIAEGVEALNMMLAAWVLDDVDISHTTLTSSSTFPIGSQYEEGTVYLLASRLSTNYEVPQTFDADAFFRKIENAYLTIAEMTLPNALIYTPSRKARDGTQGFD